MWSRLKFAAQEAAAHPEQGVPGASQPELLSEWWAPALRAERPAPEPTEEDLAVAAEWFATGFSAPDPPPPAPTELDLAAVSEWSAPVKATFDEPDLATMPEWAAHPQGAVAAERSLALAESAATLAAPRGRVVRTRAEGTFSITGLALASGHLVFEGVTFPHRLVGTPRPEAVQLTISAEENIAPGGLVAMADSGFGPGPEGFTLVLAAAAPGRFHARGRYEVGVD